MNKVTPKIHDKTKINVVLWNCLHPNKTGVYLCVQTGRHLGAAESFNANCISILKVDQMRTLKLS